MSSDRPNVLQVCTYYYPYTGGIQRMVRTLIEGIDDVDFRILTCRTKGSGRTDVENGTRIVRAGSFGPVKSTPMAPTFPYHLRKQLAWADLIHYHLPFPVGPVSHLLNGVDTPTVVTFHDDIIGKGPVLYPYKPVLHRFLDGVESIIVTSPNMRDGCDAISPFAGKATVVPIGVKVQGGDVEPKPLAGRKLLFVGRLVDFKGVDNLISAMADLDATLSIVGKGPARESLERHAREVGVTDRVTFEGFVTDERLDRLYEDATVFVLPSDQPNESFGIVQLEAMQRGLPVINTDLPTGVPYVSVDGETGLTVTPGEPGEIASAARRILENPDLYRRFSATAQRRVREEFTRESMLDRTEAVYRDALGEG